jgi:adenosylhomocysteine nucleosidase
MMTTGDGARRARQSIEELLATVEPRVLIGIGCAGAATPGLGAGELLTAERVFDQESGAAVVTPDSCWLRRANTLRGVVAGSIVSVPRIARGPEAKARAARAAPDGPAVVDLESWSWARAAADREVPFVLLRGVTDTLNERLPLDFEALRDSSGSVDRTRVLLAASFRPARWPALLSLRRRLHGVAERLADCALEVAAA